MFQKLLILDLDETLIYATEKPLSKSADLILWNYSVYKRPYLEKFLMFCQNHFKIAIWTSAGEMYAQNVAKQILPKSLKLEFLWSSEKCTTLLNYETREYYSLKNLKKIKRKGYSLQNVLILDDSPEKCQKNYGNHLPIKSFLGEDDDFLLILINYLEQIKSHPNYRSLEKRFWYTRTKALLR